MGGRHGLPSGIVTFLLTDVVGSTRGWQRSADAMDMALIRHTGLIEAAVTGHGGTMLRHRGEDDSTVSVFSRASDAVRAALNAQRALVAESWPSGVRLSVRFALHSGEAIERDGDYFGPAVNRTARLRALGSGGDILLSGTTADLAADDLPAGAQLADLGPRQLRDLDRAERVFGLAADGIRTPVVVPDTTTAPSLDEFGVTAREAEVLAALGERLTNAEIAARLYVSRRTVETHIAALLRKLGAANRRELAEIWKTTSTSAEPPRTQQRPPARTAVVQLLADSSTFVGRRSELTRAGVLLDTVSAGTARTLFLVGEPGVGKTRLAAAIAADAAARDFTVLYGRCEEGLAAPYQPVVEAVGPWLAACPDPGLGRIVGRHASELGQLWPELGSRLAVTPSLSGADPQTQRWRLFEAVAGLVRSIAAERPLLLVVDDVHWAEPSTLLLLAHLVRRAVPNTALVSTLRPAESVADPAVLLGDLGTDNTIDVVDLARSAVPRFALVATARHGESGKAPVDLFGDLGTTRSIEIIEVGGLDEGEVAELVALHAGDTPPEDLSAQLCRHTDGNPFFVAAVLAHLEDVAFVRSPAGVWVTAAELDAAGVPQGVRGVISRRLALLGPEARRALGAAAVAGLGFDQKIIAGVLDFDLEATIDALDAAIAAGLVREVDTGQYSFAHALVRHTMLDDLSRTRLAHLHWRIAEQLERHHPSQLGEIADHYVSGRRIGDDATVARTSLAAGKDALERVAFGEAAGHLRMALDALDRLPPDPDLRYQTLAALRNALTALGEIDEAHRLWLQAADIARRARDPERMFAVVQAHGYRFRITTDVEQLRLLDDLLDVLGPSDSALRASALGWKAVQNIATVPSQEDVRMAADAVAMAKRTGQVEALLSTLQSRLLIEANAPDAEAMLRTAQEAAVAAREHVGPMWSDPLSVEMRLLTMALVRLGRRDDAERQLAIHLRQAEQTGHRISVHDALVFRSALATASGQFAEGKALAAEAAQWAGRHRMMTELVYIGQIINGRMEQGRLDAVIARLSALDSLDFEVPGSRAMLAGALADDGRLDEALRQLDRLARAAPAADVQRLIGHTPMAIRYVSEVCRHLSDPERATKLLAHVTAWAGQILVGSWGMSIEGASDRAVGHLLATLGRFDDADAAYTAAAELERSAGFPPLVARTQYWHARTLLDRDAPGDRERARALLNDVIDVTDRLGMALLHRQARSSREQLDARPIL